MENDESKLLAIFCLCVTTVLVALVLSATLNFYLAVNAGLIEGVLPGMSGTHWVKP
jgi:hypothetical protein